MKKLLVVALCVAQTYFVAINCNEKKPWTFLVYIAGDNDLSTFIERNLSQMCRVGSNQNLNIVVQVNRSHNKRNKFSEIFFIEKDKKNSLFITHDSLLIDSGKPEALIQFCKFAIEHFPADNYALILWDHGTGSIDPHAYSRTHIEDIFSFNDQPAEPLPSLFLENFLTIDERPSSKGICFDDTMGSCLSDEKLHYALDTIVKKILHGKKFSLIGFDACLMAMIETASTLKNYADIMVASQEVELGPGWDYGRTLAPFLFGVLTKEQFGIHIVESYKKTYSYMKDYTFSCINLNHIQALESNIEQVSRLLVQAFDYQISDTAIQWIRASSHSHFCTHFDEPTFIDLHHFYENLIEKFYYLQFQNSHEELSFKKIFTEKITKGIKLFTQTILANEVGPKHARARGLSIYFPEHSIHNSYRRNSFAQSSRWIQFLSRYHKR